MDELWWKNDDAPEEVFIAYDRDFIRKVVMGASAWGRCHAIPIALEGTPHVPSHQRLIVAADGQIVHMPSRNSLVRPLVVVNSNDKVLAHAAMHLAYHLGCPACEMWPERKEIVRVVVVQWNRYVNGRRM